MNRKQAPALRPFRPVIPANPKTLRLPNKTPLFLFPDETTDIFYFGIVVPAGQRSHTHPLIPSLTGHMLSEGTEGYSAAALAEAIDYYGAYFIPDTGRDHAMLQMYSPTRHAVPVTDLLYEIFTSPSFPAGRLKLQIQQRLSQYRIDRQKVKTLAAEAFLSSIFGASHPYGKTLKEDDFRHLNKEQLVRFHSEFFQPSNAYYILGGNIPDAVIEMTGKLFGSNTQKTSAGKIKIPAIPKSSGKQIYIPVKGAVQSAIRVGFATINKRHEDYPLFQLLTTLLGGYFGSRLQKNIREEKGYTYGIGASLVSANDSGYFSISTEAGASVCQPALDEMYKEIDLLCNQPVGKAELLTVKKYMSGEFIRMFDGFTQNITAWRSAWDFGMDYSYFSRYYQKIMNATPAQLQEIARRYFIREQFHEVVAGKK